MTPLEIALLALVAGVAAVALVALRFPRGRTEWPLDARRTAWLLVSGFTGVLVFALLYTATRDVLWPAATAMVFYSTALVLALLLAVSVFLPQGLRTRP